MTVKIIAAINDSEILNFILVNPFYASLERCHNQRFVIRANYDEAHAPRTTHTDSNEFFSQNKNARRQSASWQIQERNRAIV
jgi:hypothetical protein